MIPLAEIGLDKLIKLGNDNSKIMFQNFTADKLNNDCIDNGSIELRKL